MGVAHGKSPEKIENKRSFNLSEITARVDRISVDGLKRIKDDIIIRAVTENDLFKANNFAEMLERSQAVKNKLESLGCFREVFVQVDTSSGPKSTPEFGYEVTFAVRELRTVSGGIQTTVGTNNEGMVVIAAKAPNLFGRAEKLQGEFSYGNKQTRNFNAVLSKPLLTKFNASVPGSIFGHEQEWTMSKYKLRENGGLLDLSFFTLKNLKHSVQMEFTLRDLVVGNRYAAFEVRENAGSTLKSSIRHIVSLDTRRSLIFPTSGMLMKLTTEFAGLFGNVGFLKNEALLQLNVPLIADCVLQGSISGGLLKPLDSGSKSVSVCDHYFLGGPTTFRGFDMRGAGPSVDGTFVGAKMYWCAGLSLFTPLPFRPSVGGFGEYCRTHFFTNIGNVGNFNSSDGFQSFVDQARFAYGVGLALRLGNLARLEINYCLPTWVREGDRAVHGVQIGLGLGT